MTAEKKYHPGDALLQLPAFGERILIATTSGGDSILDRDFAMFRGPDGFTAAFRFWEGDNVEGSVSIFGRPYVGPRFQHVGSSFVWICQSVSRAEAEHAIKRLAETGKVVEFFGI